MVGTLSGTQPGCLAQVAKANLDHAGLANKVEIIVGPAAESLAKLNPSVPFDFVFIDADKAGNLTYFKEAKRLTRKGAIIVSAPRMSRAM